MEAFLRVNENTTCWLTSSLQRIFPNTLPRNSEHNLLSARNERVSFQACVRNTGVSPITAEVSVEGPDDLGITVRRVGYVPVPHHNTDTEEAEFDGVGNIPGFVPDPLFPEQEAVVGPMETHAFWVTVNVSAEVSPGKRELRVRIKAGEETETVLPVSLEIAVMVIRPVTDFPVAHWFYADALCDWYDVQPYTEDFWRIVRPYMRNVVEHGGSCMYVPIFTPPTDGVKRPHQLLRVTEPSPGRYEFDFTDVRRWVNLARECGAQFFEWTHLFWQWGVQWALRIYRTNDDPDSLLWPPETPATSDTYRNFLAQFLPAFKNFLEAEGLTDRSIFHLSDEPHGDEHLENYRRARAMLSELAPWMKVADAMSDIRYGKEGLTDMPIPSIRAVREYREAGIPAMHYFCCGPRGAYLNRLMDTPLSKIRMSGWLFHRFEARGFLHWGYNYWYKSQTQKLIDPFTEQSGEAWPNWAYGDTFVVYPGADGPIDSIRWEVFAESLQDYALLRTVGIGPDDELLADLRDYDDFPKTKDWIASARKRILADNS